jgi:hypothetical protein
MKKSGEEPVGFGGATGEQDRERERQAPEPEPEPEEAPAPRSPKKPGKEEA